jgi:hypothetical protein
VVLTETYFGDEAFKAAAQAKTKGKPDQNLRFEA